MGGGEDRVELALADKVDCLSAGKTGAGGEIMRVAVAILGGNAGEDAVRQAVVDEVGCSRLVADYQVTSGTRRLPRGVQYREQLSVVGTVLVAYRAARREAAAARQLVEVGRAGRAVNDAVIGSVDGDERPHLAIGIVLQHPFPRHGDAETVGDDVDALGASEVEDRLHEFAQDRHSRSSSVRDT